MRRAEIISDLLRRANLSAPDCLVADVASAIVDAGGDHLVIYVVDYAQQTLQSVGLAFNLVEHTGVALSLDGTMAGRAFRTQRVVSAETVDGWRVWAPLRERSEQLGVLEAGFATLDDETLALCEDLGRLVGHLARTAGRYTDLFELRRRQSAMSLPAELQWDMLLPPLAFQCPQLSVAGKLEPAYDVGGDGFDYAINGDVFSFVFLDAMGHNLRSALASTLVLAGSRHGRRQGLDLRATAEEIDRMLIDEFGGEIFVTGHLGQLDLATGQLSWINAGHPDPVLARGVRVVGDLHAVPCRPLGLGISITEVGEQRLEPGDRILFYSDGVTEARPLAGVEFGYRRLVDRFERHLSDGLLPSEMLRRITSEVVEHQRGALKDDASLMLLQWQPPTERP